MNTVHKRVLCQAPPERVFDALISESIIAQWMTAEVEMEPWISGDVLVRVQGWPDVVGHVIELEAPRRLVLGWHAANWRTPATLTVEVASAEAGCWVVIDETGFADDDAAILAERDTLWSHWLIRLAAVVARA